MTLDIAADRVPLALDDDGVARVGGSRVPIDTVVCAFTDGATVERHGGLRVHRQSRLRSSFRPCVSRISTR